MLLRGIAARRLQTAAIFAVALLAVCGAVVAVGFSRPAHVSQGSAGALVLLGLVALGSASAESVRRREPELALARLRGRHGARLLLLAVTEPIAVLAAGAALGVEAGWLVGGVAVRRWLPAGSHFSLGVREWAAAGIVTVAGAVVIATASWRATRTPLSRQLTGVRRPRGASAALLFLQLLLVLGAVVAIYQSSQARASRVDWLSLISPAIVGLAAGQLLVWLVQAILRFGVPRSARSDIGWFVTLRRLLRRADSLAVLRLMVAAGCVFAVAASAATSSTGWREQRARLQVGAPVSYPVAAGALRAEAAAASADPGGRWLLPVASYTDSTQDGERRVFVSASRWQAVVGDFLASTDAAPLSGLLQRLPTDAGIGYGRGPAVTATVTSATGAGTVALTLQYVDDTGNLATAGLPLRARTAVAAPGGTTTYRVALPRCREACSLLEIDVSGQTTSPLVMTDIDFAGQHVLRPAAGAHIPSTPYYGTAFRRTGSGLVIRARLLVSESVPLADFRSHAPLAVVASSGTRPQVADGHPVVLGVDGSARSLHVVARLPVLPFVGTRGFVGDLGSVLSGAGGSIPETTAVVLARADTPSKVIAALRRTGAIGSPTTYAAELARLDRTPRAQGTRLYLVVAGFAALIALVGAAAAAAQQVGERRSEAASLRSVGVLVRKITGAYRREALLLAVATAAGTAVAAWVTCRVLLPALPLVSGWAFAPPLDAAPDLRWILTAAAAAGGVVAFVVWLAFHRVARTARPRLLREDVS